MIEQKEKIQKRMIRHLRVRKDISGTPERPRMSVYRSLKNIYCQLIDDVKGTTILSMSTLSEGIRDKVKFGGNVKAAQILGEEIAKAAVQKGIKRVCFDRGGFKYHGRIKILADAARKNGLQF